MGTLVNAIAVVAGSLIGLLIRRGLPERVEGAAMKLLGLSVLIIGFNGVVTSMVTVGADGSLSSGIGGVSGELWEIDDKLTRMGKRIEERFGKEGFAKGFINGSLIYCIGAMAIIGALNDGLTGDSSILYIKSALDFVCSIILASTLGFGVLFSALPVALYQGGITLFAGVLSPLVSDALLGGICMVGYAIVLCIGINFLEFTTIRTANLLPALAVPVAWQLLRSCAGLIVI